MIAILMVICPYGEKITNLNRSFLVEVIFLDMADAYARVMRDTVHATCYKLYGVGEEWVKTDQTMRLLSKS